MLGCSSECGDNKSDNGSSEGKETSGISNGDGGGLVNFFVGMVGGGLSQINDSGFINRGKGGLDRNRFSGAASVEASQESRLRGGARALGFSAFLGELFRIALLVNAAHVRLKSIEAGLVSLALRSDATDSAFMLGDGLLFIDFFLFFRSDIGFFFVVLMFKFVGFHNIGNGHNGSNSAHLGGFLALGNSAGPEVLSVSISQAFRFNALEGVLV